MTTYRIERASDPRDLARRASQTIAGQIDLALNQRDRCRVHFRVEAHRRRRTACWSREIALGRVDVFLGDERWVAADDASSMPSC